MTTATKSKVKKTAGKKSPTAARTTKGAPKRKAPAEQKIIPEVDDSDPEIEKALKAYFGMKDEHGALTRDLTAEKQRVLGLLADKKIKRYWSKRMDRGVELVPEGEKLAEMKNPEKKKAKKAKATASQE